MARIEIVKGVSDEAQEKIFEYIGRLLKQEYDNGYSRIIAPMENAVILSAVEEIVEIIKDDC